MNDQVIEMQTKGLEQMKSMQAQVADFHERVADSVVSAMPEIPTPFAEYLPTPKAVVSNYFEFMTQVRDANQEFVERVVGAWDREEVAAK